MKTFEEAAERYMTTAPGAAGQQEMEAWLRTIRSSDAFMHQIGELRAFAIKDLVLIGEKNVESRLEGWLVSALILGLMIGIEMEKPE